MENTILSLLELRKELQNSMQVILFNREPEFADIENAMLNEYRKMIYTLDAELACIKG